MSTKPNNSNEIKAAFGEVERGDFKRRFLLLLGKKEVKEVTISQIFNGLILVSPKRAKIIEKATRGKVRASVLRPDIFRR
jgi:DNA-binding transcriptional regulator YdaS (Cro superfamily)